MDEMQVIHKAFIDLEIWQVVLTLSVMFVALMNIEKFIRRFFGWLWRVTFGRSFKKSETRVDSAIDGKVNTLEQSVNGKFDTFEKVIEDKLETVITLINRVNERIDGVESSHRGVSLELMRSALLRLYYEIVEQAYINMTMYSTFLSMYARYEELGGNGKLAEMKRGLQTKYENEIGRK
jgi:hypothetical protein